MSDRAVIGMDPHKRSATIELMAGDGTIGGGGRFDTDRDGYTAMKKYFESDGWLVVGTENLAGPHPDRSPGSTDLNLLQATLKALQERPAPGARRGSPRQPGSGSRTRRRTAGYLSIRTSIRRT